MLHKLYQQAKAQRPERWITETRDWILPDKVWLNPEKKNIANKDATSDDIAS